MTLRMGLVAAALCLTGFFSQTGSNGLAWAEAPGSSLRPAPRPMAAAASAAELPAAGEVPSAGGAAVRAAGMGSAGAGAIAAAQPPKPRPMLMASAAQAALDFPASRGASPGAIVAGAAVAPQAQSALADRIQIKPKPRPLSFARRINGSASAALQDFDQGFETAPALQPVALSRNNRPGKSLSVPSAKGSVCGDPAIKGEVLAPIGAKVNGCGIPDPVRVTSVAGIRLSQAATVDCATAKALKRWIDTGLRPAYGKQKVVQLQIAGSYMCRTRNHKKGAKISEHGRGKAIDIAGLTFASGKSVSVKGHYDATMRKAHRAACGIFGTTLGPGSDGMHEDHLHFDVARHRNGAYCR